MSIEIPGYKILRVLGKGGMATVYLAIQEVFEREVALKIMSKALAEDPNFAQRFFREAKIVSKLVHPNIVTVHDVGKQGDNLYLSMEYIDGHDLRYRMPKLKLRQKLRVIRDIAKALEYAGAKGYVHRDIKPENIMFHSSDQRAVLMDFGIARAAETKTTVTQTGTAIGTPHYMSPEQAKGLSVDSRSDIYSLGVVLYLMFAGRVPYDAESAVAIGIKHITEPVPLLPPEYKSLQFLLDNMMAKNVKHRYQSAKQLIADLDQLDLDVVEHSIKMSKATAGRNSESDTTVFNRVDEDLAEAEVPDAAPFADFDSYEAHDTEIRGGFSVIPWLVSGSFVVAVLLGFLYIKDPVQAEMWIAQAKQALDDVFAGNNEAQVIDPQRVAERKVSEKHDGDNAERSVVSQATSVPALSENRVRDKASITPKPVVSPPAPAQTNRVAEKAKQAKIDALVSRVEQLQDRANEPVYFVELVEAYRALQTLLPSKDASTYKKAYTDLQQQQLAQLQEQAQTQGESLKLLKKIEQFESLFPDVPASTLKPIKAQAKQRKKVVSLLLEADAYLKQNNLTQPKGRNALEAYDRVLAIDPANASAQDGRKFIARKLVSLADKRLQAGDEDAARSLVDKSLEIYPQNGDARKLRDQLSAEASKARKVGALLESAEQKVKSQDLYTPAGRAAYDDFSEVLRLDPGNQQALQGQEALVDALSSKVWRLVGQRDTGAVKASLQQALKVMPDNQRIRSLAAAAEEMLGEELVLANP